MKSVLVIGGATLDTIIQYEQMETLVHQSARKQQSYLLLEEGSKIEVTEQNSFSGGGATNAAMSFKRQGFDVKLFCKIGQDLTGEVVLQELQDGGIDTSNVRYSAKVGTANSFVVPSLKGDRTVFAYRGANTTLTAQEMPYEVVPVVDFMYVTSLSRAAAKAMPEIVACAQQHQVPVAVNPGVSQLQLGGGFLHSALSGIDILILNFDEAKQFMASLLQIDDHLREALEQQTPRAEMADKLLDSETVFQDMRFSLRQFFQEVMRLGPKTVVVTDGDQGVYVATPERLYYHRSIQIDNVVNTLGAGDAFGSSFVGALHQGQSIADAIRWGVVNSAAVIQHPDAKTGLQSVEAIQQRVSQLETDWLVEKVW